jgi:hypothetical protein
MRHLITARGHCRAGSFGQRKKEPHLLQTALLLSRSFLDPFKDSCFEWSFCSVLPAATAQAEQTGQEAVR